MDHPLPVPAAPVAPDLVRLAPGDAGLAVHAADLRGFRTLLAYVADALGRPVDDAEGFAALVDHARRRDRAASPPPPAAEPAVEAAAFHALLAVALVDAEGFLETARRRAIRRAGAPAGGGASDKKGQPIR